MKHSFILFKLCVFIVTFLSLADLSLAAKLDIPPCPSESKRFFIPTGGDPTWTGCRDKSGLYQGLIIQFSNQTEAIRIASVKNSLRNGIELRFGKKGTLEERHYLNGHLQGGSYIFRSDNLIGRLVPKGLTAEDWRQFDAPSETSVLKKWLNQEPFSSLSFSNGRLTMATYKGKTYHFKITPDGRIFSEDHPELKHAPLIDSESLWVLNADDLKHTLVPGFGSCKKYAAPIGRFVRNYDHLLFKREGSEVKHLDKLQKIRERFIEFCFPQELKQYLGELECAPQLPSDRPARKCLLSYSDQIRIHYEPKYFKHEFTLKKSPEDFLAMLFQAGFLLFISKPNSDQVNLTLPDNRKIQVKKVARGLIYRVIDEAFEAAKDGKDNDWWQWKEIPGY